MTEAEAREAVRAAGVRLVEEGLVAGTWGNVIRFMPPLVISEDEVALVLDAVGAAMAATA